MTDVDGKKIKSGDQVWVYDHSLGNLRLAVVQRVKGTLARTLWVTPVPGDRYTGAYVGPDNLVRCTGQD
jgi:hypothetical protein